MAARLVIPAVRTPMPARDMARGMRLALNHAEQAVGLVSRVLPPGLPELLEGGLYLARRNSARVATRPPGRQELVAAGKWLLGEGGSAYEERRVVKALAFAWDRAEEAGNCRNLMFSEVMAIIGMGTTRPPPGSRGWLRAAAMLGALMRMQLVSPAPGLQLPPLIPGVRDGEIFLAAAFAWILAERAGSEDGEANLFLLSHGFARARAQPLAYAAGDAELLAAELALIAGCL